MSKKLIIVLLSIALVFAIAITAALYIAIPYLMGPETTTKVEKVPVKQTTVKTTPVADTECLHTVIIDDEVIATCTAPGLTKGQHCSVCGKVLVKQQEVPMAPHTYDDENDKECNVCGYIRDDDCEHPELLVLPAVEPTCYELGLTEGRRCAVCHATVVPQKVLDKVNHKESDWIIYKEPTKTKTGLRYTECVMCGKRMSEEIIPALGSEGLLYTLNPDKESYNVSIGTCVDTDVVILAEYKGKPVTHIADYGFYACNWIVSVDIPNSMTVIGDYAFRYCTGLESIELPDSVVRIGRSAFRYCTALESVTMGDSVKFIGENAFYKCVSLTSVDIPASVVTIEPAAFAECTALTSINVDSSSEHFKSVDGNLYNKDENALVQYAVGKKDTEFTVPSTVKRIADFAFRGATSLVSVDMSDKVTYIGSGAFFNCESLVNVKISSNVTSIGHSVFRNCASLESVVIPKGVKTIGEAAFYKCLSLVSVTIPGGVTSIGKSAFYDCVLLTSIEIPSTVTIIGDYAFFRCLTLAEVKMYNSVETLGEGAFYKCKSLKTIDLGDALTTIGDYAFYQCIALTDVVVTEELASIGEAAFSECHALETITFVGHEYRWQAVEKGTYWNHNADNLTIEVVAERVTVEEEAGDDSSNTGSNKVPAVIK